MDFDITKKKNLFDGNLLFVCLNMHKNGYCAL
jgi:hypothetical protein